MNKTIGWICWAIPLVMFAVMGRWDIVTFILAATVIMYIVFRTK